MYVCLGQCQEIIVEYLCWDSRMVEDINVGGFLFHFLDSFVQYILDISVKYLRNFFGFLQHNRLLLSTAMGEHVACSLASFLACFHARARGHKRPVLDDCSVHNWSWFLALSSSFVNQLRQSAAPGTCAATPACSSPLHHRYSNMKFRSCYITLAHSHGTLSQPHP